MYLYIKALHIIFVVTWFAGLFYMVRLFIYNREANDRPEPERKILQPQLQLMIDRLWFIITWPSCIITVFFGTWLLILYNEFPAWLILKILFVFGLLLYHVSLHIIYRQQKENNFKYSPQQLRVWNEIATLFLFAIVFLVVLKSTLNFIWGMVGLLSLAVILMLAIKIYKSFRNQ